MPTPPATVGKRSVTTETLPVEGMTCASCVRRVEQALMSVPGVSKASVNLATENATVAYDPGSVSLDRLADAVDSAGYRLHTERSALSADTAQEATEPAESDASPSEPTPRFSEAFERRKVAYAALRKEFAISLGLTIPIMLYSMFSMSAWFMRSVPIPMQTGNTLLFLATSLVLLFSGRRFYATAWKLAKHMSADMNTLVALGTGAAYSYSAAVTLFPQWFQSLNNSVYFDSAATIITLILLGKMLEARAKNRTTEAMRALLTLQPPVARVRRGKEIVSLPLSAVVVGDLVQVLPGERVPVDGAIVAGSTAIDESMVTGESFPVQKSPGDTVLGGTINTNGSIEFRAVAVGAQTMVARIGALIEQAQGSKAKIQARADIIASVFVPIVLGVSLLTFVYWFAIGGAPLASALMNAIAVLVIACPCALGLATPTAIIVGTSAAASLGVLIKNAESLERLQRVDTIIFDKTGTLSLGTPAIATVTPLNGFAEERMVQLAVALESRSEHPAGSAFREYAKRQGIDGGEVEQFTSLPGKGLSGIVSGEPVIVGSRGYMEENSIDCSAATVMSASGDTGILVYIAASGKLAGIVALADSIKPSAYEAVAALRAKGYRIILLSGDRDEAVRGLAKELGIDQVAGRMFPADKEAYVKRLEAEGHPVAFVGDGVNDGPALASASAGIAIGTGTDVAKEAADILLIGEDLNGIVRLIVLSGRIIGVIRQNLFWAFVYNMIGIPLAALGLLNPMFAASAMALSSVSVVSNSLRLKNVDKIRKARDFSHF